MTIGAVFAEQFERMLSQLAEAVQTFPEDQWRVAEARSLIPARLAYHAVEACDLMARETPEGFVRGGRFGVSHRDATPEQLPDQAGMVAYIDEVKERACAWATAKSDADYMKEESVGFRQPTALARCAYNLRHTQHHVGQLISELRRRGITPPKWR
jgi:uncharacterized damage-inducible protein DinB